MQFASAMPSARVSSHRQCAKKTVPPCLFASNFPKRSRLTPSRPDAILITPDHTKPSSSAPSPSSSRHVLRSRHGTSQRTSKATRVRKPHELSANQQHTYLLEVRYCEGAWPGLQLDVAQRQHAEKSKWRKSQKPDVQKFFKENTVVAHRNARTEEYGMLFVLETFLTYHIQMYAPAKVKSQLSKFVHVNERALRFSAFACLNQDVNT
eukprot:1149948-Pelagomonas_calceolata.AAC.1